MNSKKTCDKCAHYTQSEHTEWPDYVYAGSCALMGDSNDQRPVVAIDKAAGWDYEGYSSGVYVGPKFGCVHWVRSAKGPLEGV